MQDLFFSLFHNTNLQIKALAPGATAPTAVAPPGMARTGYRWCLPVLNTITNKSMRVNCFFRQKQVSVKFPDFSTKTDLDDFVRKS